jgi:DNA-binding winged helix-turn-helix (wHTH) protein
MHDPGDRVPMIRFGPFELDTRSDELRKGASRVKVPDQSIQIRKALVEHPASSFLDNAPLTRRRS